MKLLIDENISPLIADHLKAQNYDVKSIRDCCKGYPDERVVELAISEGRVIVTYDLDFGELYRNLGASSIILRLRTRKPSAVQKHLLSFLHTAENKKMDMKNKLVIISEGKVRVIG